LRITDSLSLQHASASSSIDAQQFELSACMALQQQSITAAGTAVAKRKEKSKAMEMSCFTLQR
jgi:hypothetical protein